MSETFRVRITTEIEKCDERGSYQGERLTTREEIRIPLDSFTDIAAVLGRFHELAGHVREEHIARLPMARGCAEARAQFGEERCRDPECQRCHGPLS